jgi:hypothetical protein
MLSLEGQQLYADKLLYILPVTHFHLTTCNLLFAFIFHLLRRIVMGCDWLLSFHLSFISSLPNGNGHREPWRKTMQSDTYMAYLSFISSLFSVFGYGCSFQ